jgi:outer membrane protein TolC
MHPGTDPRNLNIGLSVNIPLFLGYQNTYRIRAARDSVDRSSAARDRLRNDISLEVWRSWQDVRTQGQAVQTAGDLVRSATESHEMALGRYRSGVGSVLDLLTAQTSLLQAAVQQIQTRLRLNVSKLALARAIGTLDPALFTDRPVATSR